MNKLVLALVLLPAFCAVARAGIEEGRVTELGTDHFVVQTEKGETLKFTLSEDVKKGKTQIAAYIHKFKEVQVGYDVRIDYRKDGEKLICEGIRITKRRGGS